MNEVFSLRLRRALKWREMTITELAKRTGLLVSNLSHFQCERKLPNMENLFRIANGLDVSVDFLLGRTANFVAHRQRRNEPLPDKNDAVLSMRDQQLLVDFTKLLLKRSKELGG